MASGQRLSCDSADFDTISTSTVPIIVVPGVMGSRLRVPGGTNWDPDYAPSMAGWLGCSTRAGRKDLSVTIKPGITIIGKLSDYKYTPGSQDAKTEVNADSQLIDLASEAGHASPYDLYNSRGWGEIAWGFYGPILTYLEKQFNHQSCSPNGKHPVYAFGYDWRKTNADSAAKLKSRVAAILAKCKGGQEVILVTHSMGGLVARYACTQLGLNDKVRGVIHTVQPANGAVVCYRRFSTGCTTESEAGGKDPINMILGDAWWKYTAYMSGLQGPIQLLPNALYASQSQPGCSDPIWLQEIDAAPLDLAAIYDTYVQSEFPGVLKPADQLPETGYQLPAIQAIWDSEIIPALRRRIQEARSFHDTLGSAAHPLTYIIYTNGEKTDERVEWKDDLLAKVQTYTGDGTVPSISAGCFNLSVISRTVFSSESNLKHSDVFKNGNIRDKVREHVNEILAP